MIIKDTLKRKNLAGKFRRMALSFSLFLTVTVTSLPSEMSIDTPPAPSPTSVINTEDDITPVHSSSSMTITYNGKEIDAKKTPLIRLKKTYMVPFEPLLCKKGPKLTLEYGSNRHVKLVYENSVFTFFGGDNYYYSNGKKHTFTRKPVEKSYSASGKKYWFVPLTDLCSALKLKCNIHRSSHICQIRGSEVRFEGTKKYTKYAYSKKTYAKLQHRSVGRVSVKQYMKYISPTSDTTHGFQFLRVDQYRPVNKKAFTNFYQYLIRDYCRQLRMSPKKSVLYGRANTFLNTAKKYNIDPVYLVNQTFLESAYGTSWLASGNRIKKIAYPNYARKKNGKFKTKKIKTKKKKRKTVKVYNLYGIKAYDSDPYVGATSYAYYHGWTTVKKAIVGAAKYLRSNYIGGKYRQNTLFKIRYTFRAAIWHQYATGPNYAESIGKRVFWMSSVYAGNAKFVYDYPRYK